MWHDELLDEIHDEFRDLSGLDALFERTVAKLERKIESALAWRREYQRATTWASNCKECGARFEAVGRTGGRKPGGTIKEFCTHKCASRWSWKVNRLAYNEKYRAKRAANRKARREALRRAHEEDQRDREGDRDAAAGLHRGGGSSERGAAHGAG